MTSVHMPRKPHLACLQREKSLKETFCHFFVLSLELQAVPPTILIRYFQREIQLRSLKVPCEIVRDNYIRVYILVHMRLQTGNP